MRRRLKHILFTGMLLMVLSCALGLEANAFTYQSVPDNLNLDQFRVTIGGVTLPLEEYPDGTWFDPNKSVMTDTEAAKYGISHAVDLRGWECVGFARYVYTALYYQYPADATIDTSLAYDHGNSYAYRNVIYEVLGTKTLEAGYSASTLKTLITSSYPGTVMRAGGHSMVIMAIFNEGFVVYDANFGSTNTVDLRYYSWDSFVSSMGSRTITAVHMPSYYPGYRYSTGSTGGTVDEDYVLDTTSAGIYDVINVSTTLNVRSGPAYSASIVGKLQNGDIVVVRGTYGGWAAVEFDSAVCWVHTDYLSYAENQSNYPLNLNDAGSYQVYNCQKLNIRSGPDSTTEKVGTLPVGTVIDVIGSYNGWAAFNYNGTTCWGYMVYLTPYSKEITVGFDANGGTASYASGTYKAGNVFGQLPDATKADRNLLGWYDGDTWYTEGSVVPDATSLTLTAKWGLFSFVDATEGRFYSDSVVWAVMNNVTNGMTSTTFEPDLDCQRGHVVTFLWRAFGCPEPTITQCDFTDVNPGAFYYKAMLWAVEKGITNGMTETTFEPETICTRAQVVTLLWRAAGSVQPTITGSKFTDVDSNRFYYNAMLWAVEHGVVNGLTETTFEPILNCTRAQAVTFLYRLMGKTY